MDALETLIRDVTSLLDKLGALGSSEQIRDYFIQEQITGHRRGSDSCPVHTYLVRELDGATNYPVNVGTRRTGIGEAAELCVSHPEPVRKFISDFDNRGLYSELIPE